MYETVYRKVLAVCQLKLQLVNKFVSPCPFPPTSLLLTSAMNVSFLHDSQQTNHWSPGLTPCSLPHSKSLPILLLRKFPCLFSSILISALSGLTETQGSKQRIQTCLLEPQLTNLSNRLVSDVSHLLNIDSKRL